jgi:S1-C subfamily serine protease
VEVRVAFRSTTLVLVGLLPFGACSLPSLPGAGPDNVEPSAERSPGEPPQVVFVPPAMKATEGELATLPDVAERVVKSVVSVSIQRVEPVGFRRGMSQVESGIGSGVIVDKGVVVTNNHVVANADSMSVVLHDGTELQAKVIGTDPKSDLAVLRLVDPPDGLVALPVGDSDALRLGEPVLAVGNPFNVGQTVTMGIVSALGRSNMNINDYEDFIQTDAAINPGNSGGALVDLRGRLVGVNTAIYSRTGGSNGIGFAIPVSMVRYVVDEILEDGRVDRGFLGVSIQDVTPGQRRQLGLIGSGGALVSGVGARSPAEEAGIEPGDVVVEFDGEPVTGSSRFRIAVAAAGPEQPFTLAVLRDGARTDLAGTTGVLPDDDRAAQLRTQPRR